MIISVEIYAKLGILVVKTMQTKKNMMDIVLISDRSGVED